MTQCPHCQTDVVPRPDGNCPSCGGTMTTNPFASPIAGKFPAPVEEALPDGVKQRHGCLTAWLIWMMIANVLTAIAYIVMGEQIKEALPNAVPNWVFPVFIVLSIFNVVCAIAIFSWKRWGFWGFCFTAACATVLNVMIGVGAQGIMGAFVGIAILFGLLQIGNGPTKGWNQLE